MTQISNRYHSSAFIYQLKRCYSNGGVRIPAGFTAWQAEFQECDLLAKEFVVKNFSLTNHAAAISVMSFLFAKGNSSEKRAFIHLRIQSRIHSTEVVFQVRIYKVGRDRI